MAALWLLGTPSAYAQTAAWGDPAESLRPLLSEDFSDGLDGWEVQRLARRLTQYTLVETPDGAALKVNSNDAAAALLYRLEDDPRAVDAQRGMIRWRWQVMTSLADNDRETESAGDDFAARLFVLFGSSELDRDTRAIAYVWAGREAVGRRFPSPRTDQVSTIVLQSGNAKAGAWVLEERDVLADYVRAFGEPAPTIGGVALLVDTDDTGGAAMAWFDDIELSVGTAPEQPSGG